MLGVIQDTGKNTARFLRDINLTQRFGQEVKELLLDTDNCLYLHYTVADSMLNVLNI